MLQFGLQSEVSSDVRVDANARLCKAAAVALHPVRDKLNSSFLWGVPPTNSLCEQF